MNKSLLLSVVVIIVLSVFLFSRNSTPSSSTSTESSSNLTIKGSDTEVQMVSNLAQAFSEQHDDVNISVTGGGSSVGIAALLNQEIDIANSSRQMKEEEITQGKNKGLQVQEFIVARDGISIVVHKDNPIEQLTMEQIKNIYTGNVIHWNQVGGNDSAISLYGRQSTSGTYGFFRDVVLQADYHESMRSMEGSQAIVDAVINDATGIGYVGVGYVKNENGEPRSDLKIIPVAQDADSDAISPLDMPAVLESRYPIFRPIYQYLPAVPAKNSSVARFLEFEASEEGQTLVQQAGFYPIIAADQEANTQLFNSMQ